MKNDCRITLVVQENNPFFLSCGELCLSVFVCKVFYIYIQLIVSVLVSVFSGSSSLVLGFSRDVPEVFLGVDRCLWYVVGTLAASPRLYTSVPVCVGSREAICKRC